MDEDPMAYLNAKRKEMEAIAEMAAVAQMQHDLAINVSSRMEKINSLLQTPKSSPSRNNSSNSSPRQELSPSSDPEVDFWRKKLAELSAPVPGVESSSGSASSPYSSPHRYQSSRDGSTNSSPLRSSPHLAAVLARDSSNAERHKLLQPDDSEAEESSDHSKVPSHHSREYPPLKVSERLNLARSASLQIEEELNAARRIPNDDDDTISSSYLSKPLSPPPISTYQDHRYPPKHIPSRSEISSSRYSSGSRSSNNVDDDNGGDGGGGGGGGDSNSRYNNNNNSNSSNSSSVSSGREDPEVEYWRKKIAELSAPSSSSSGYHTSSLPADMSPSLRSTMGQSPPSRPNLRNPRYKAHSLADEPLSWEGTASYAAEHPDKQPVRSPQSTLTREADHLNRSHHTVQAQDNDDDRSPPSSPSAAWRSQAKQLFNGDDDDDDYYTRK